MADTKSISAAGTASSDAITLQTDTVYAAIYTKLDVTGTPASGDNIQFRVLHGGGDPDGSGSDEYETSGNSPTRLLLNGFTEDPAIGQPIPLDPTAKNLKLHATSLAASNAIVVSGRLIEIGADGLKTSTLLAWT